jgi:transposase
MAALRKYPEELRQRAIRLVHEAEAEPGISRKAVCRRVGQQLGISPDTLRGWVNREEIDAGERPGIPMETAARIAELEREVRELRRANAILKSASAFFAAELDRPSR